MDDEFDPTIIDDTDLPDPQASTYLDDDPPSNTTALTIVGRRAPPARCAGRAQHFTDCRQQMLTIASPVRSLAKWTSRRAPAKHGVSDDDMLRSLRHHWRGFETDDPDVTMFIGPSANGEPLEVGVVDDADGVAIIHAMPARSKFLKGWWTP